jgi:iron complex outermembrane receptor protein
MLAQNTLPTPAQEEPLALSVFEVNANRDDGYVATNVLSGTRLNTPLQALPKPVDVITSEFLDDIGALEFADALRYTSGVAANGASGVAPEDVTGANISLRGYNTFTTYRNGFRGFGVVDTVFIDRIEVIKGPSSVFSGTIEPGGTLNIMTKRPPVRPSGSVRTVFGSFDRVRGEVVVGGPINAAKTLRYRVAGVAEDYGSYIDFAGRKRIVYGGAVDYDLTPKTRLSFEAQWVDTRAVPANANGAFVAPDRANLLGDYDHAFNRGGPDAFSDIKQGQGTAEVKHQLNDNWSFRAGLYWGYQEQHILGVGGSSIVAINATTGARTVDRVPTLTDALSNTYVPQANLAGEFKYAGIKHQVIFGMDYLGTHQTNHQHQLPTGVSLPRIDIDHPASFSLGVEPGDLTRTTVNTRLVSVQRGYTASNVFYLFDERLLLLQGFRYGTAHYNVANRVNGTVSDSESPAARTWNFGASYRIVPAMTAFVSYAESYLPQRTFDYFGNVHQPVTGEGYDYGIKYDFFNHRFTGSVVGYDIKRGNVLQPDPEHPGFNIQSGEDRSKGVEYSLLGRVTDNWQVVLAYGYNASQITKDPTRPQNVGKRTTNIPRNQGSLWNRYTFKEGALKGFGAGLGVIYVGSRRGNPSLSDLPGLESPSYTRIDARLTYERKLFGYPTSFAVSANNITDRDYLTSYVLYGEPRNYMGTISVRF